MLVLSFMQQVHINKGDILFLIYKVICQITTALLLVTNLFIVFWGQWDGEQAILKILIKQNIALIIGQND